MFSSPSWCRPGTPRTALWLKGSLNLRSEKLTILQRVLQHWSYYNIFCKVWLVQQFQQTSGLLLIAATRLIFLYVYIIVDDILMNTGCTAFSFHLILVHMVSFSRFPQSSSPAGVRVRAVASRTATAAARTQACLTLRRFRWVYSRLRVVSLLANFITLI